MLGFIEFIFSVVGIYGYFAENLICVVIGLVAIVICDFIDIFITGHNPSTILFSCILAIGASIANKNPLYTFTIVLCGENFIMTTITILMLSISFIISLFRKENDKYIRLAQIVMQALDVSNIDEALEKTCNFYIDNGVEMSNIEFEKDNKYEILSDIIMEAMGTKDIDEAIEKTITFYKSQGIDIK